MMKYLINMALMVLFAVVFLTNLNGILQYGPSPNVILMASSSAVLLLVCAVLLARHRPITKAFVVCLAAFPGALVVGMFLNDLGRFDGLGEREHSALNDIVAGMTGGGGIGLLYIAVLSLRQWFKRSRKRDPEETNS